MTVGEYEAPEPSGAVGRFLDTNEIFSIGHSTHKSGDFISLLERARVHLLVDIGRHPGSRQVPWTSSDRLEQLLADNSIDYLHLPELGGRRRPVTASANNGWHNAQFQGYADHLATPEFAAGLNQQEPRARYQPVAVMCAEAQWWRCHRRLLSDALVVRGWRVLHLNSRGTHDEHTLTDFAVVEGTELSYPAADQGKNSRRTDAYQGMKHSRHSLGRNALGAEV